MQRQPREPEHNASKHPHVLRVLASRGLSDGEVVTLATVSDRDSEQRTISDFRVTPHNIPTGCVGTCHPEANAPVPPWHHAM
jgi:hypothetical protein